MSDFYLLTTPVCPLCQEALVMIHQQPLDTPIQLSMVDISRQPELLDEYQHLVPVLVRAKDDSELRWPFGEALFDFLTEFEAD